MHLAPDKARFNDRPPARPAACTGSKPCAARSMDRIGLSTDGATCAWPSLHTTLIRARFPGSSVRRFRSVYPSLNLAEGPPLVIAARRIPMLASMTGRRSAPSHQVISIPLRGRTVPNRCLPAFLPEMLEARLAGIYLASLVYTTLQRGSRTHSKRITTPGSLLLRSQSLWRTYVTRRLSARCVCVERC